MVVVVVDPGKWWWWLVGWWTLVVSQTLVGGAVVVVVVDPSGLAGLELQTFLSPAFHFKHPTFVGLGYPSVPCWCLQVW